jgi:hypothetical protein
MDDTLKLHSSHLAAPNKLNGQEIAALLQEYEPLRGAAIPSDTGA